MRASVTVLLLLVFGWQLLSHESALGQSTDERHGNLEHLRFDPIPLARVGDAAGEPLYDVRGIVVLPGGGFVIGEGSTKSLRFFDSGGNLTRVVGRAGGGPGEFSRLYWVKRFSDRLFAYDSSHRRVTEFTLEGDLVGTVAVMPVPPYVASLVVGVFPDGSILARGISMPQSPSQAEVRRQESGLLRYGPDGDFIGQIGVFEESEAFVMPRPSGGVFSTLPLFARRSEIAVQGPNVIIAENNTPHVQVRGQDGSVVHNLESMEGLEPKPVLNRDVEMMRAIFLEKKGFGSVSRAEVFGQMPVPDTYPYFGWAAWDRRPFLATGDTEIWVMEYGGLSDAGPTWISFNVGSAKQTGELTSTDEVELWDVVGDRAAVLYRTELDEEIVELRRILIRNPGERRRGPR